MPRDTQHFTSTNIVKVDETLGLVFGYAIICKVDGEDYFDLNVDVAGPHKGKSVPEHITEEAMLKCASEAVADGMLAGNEMHAGPDSGSFVFAFPLTTEIAEALDIVAKRTGLLVAYKPTPEVLAKFKDGTYTGFSIEGARVSQEMEDA
jgi:hypothetical protein